jgi:hypothetical protein
MNAVIREDGHPCDCGFCRPDLMFSIDQEVPVKMPPYRQEADTKRQTTIKVPERHQVPALQN